MPILSAKEKLSVIIVTVQQNPANSLTDNDIDEKVNFISDNYLLVNLEPITIDKIKEILLEKAINTIKSFDLNIEDIF